MRVMKYVHRRANGTFYVVMPIPEQARHALGAGAQKWVSLRTKDASTVLRLAPPLVLDLQD
jgi:hypothetical protein